MLPFLQAFVLAAAPLSIAAAAQSRTTQRLPVPGAPAGITAFVNVGVIPMDTDRVLVNQTVLIAGGRITALGLSTTVRVPANATRIDGQGKYLIPGLADMHGHIPMVYVNYGNISIGQMRLDSVAERQLFLQLVQGVTTIRSMNAYHSGIGGGHFLDGPDVLRLRARAAAGELWSPRIYTSGPWAPRRYYINVPGGESRTPRPPLDSIAAYVAVYKAAGYDFLKTRLEGREVFDSVMAAARRVGIAVVGHVPPDVPLDHAWGMKSHEHEAGYDILSVFLAQKPDTAAFRAKAAAARRAGVWYSNGYTLVKYMQEAGVGVLLGTDFNDTTFTQIHRDLQTLVSRGLTPYQALTAGTKNPARYFETLNETGTVDVGKRADLVLLNGNPLEDIRRTEQIAGVMIGGRWLGGVDRERRMAAARAPAPHLKTTPPVSQDERRRRYASIRTDAFDIAGIDGRSTTLQPLMRAQGAQYEILLDSLEAQELDAWPAGPDTATAYRRIFTGIGQQLGAMRAELTLAQRTIFDSAVRAWQSKRKAEGHTVLIPGLGD